MKRNPGVDRLDLANSSQRALTVRLEPWGEEFAIPQGGRFAVEAVGPEGGFLELQWGDDEVTIYGWSGSTVSVWSEEKEVTRSAGILPAPPLPGAPEAEVRAYTELLKTLRSKDNQSG